MSGRWNSHAKRIKLKVIENFGTTQFNDQCIPSHEITLCCLTLKIGVQFEWFHVVDIFLLIWPLVLQSLPDPILFNK